MKRVGSLFCFLVLAACSTSPSLPPIATLKPAENHLSYGAYVNARFSAALNKPFDSTDPRPKLLLIGDSQAKDFLNSAQEHSYLNRYQIRTRHIGSQCQMFLGRPEDSGVADKLRVPCQKADSLQNALPQIAEADVVILSGLWRQWALKQLPRTIRNLRLKRSQKLVVVGRKSYGRVIMSRYKDMPTAARVRQRNRVNRQFLTDNAEIAGRLAPEQFIDQYSLTCGAGSNQCPIFTPGGDFITFDGGHLTKAGARHVGKQLLQSPAFKSLL